MAKGRYKFDTYEAPGKSKLKECFLASAKYLKEFPEQCASGAARRRPFKKGIIATLGYFMAHESHHRGSILLTLKECDHRLDQQTQYAIWEWDKS